MVEAHSPLEALSEEGVAVWLDDLSRKRLTSGNLAQLMSERSVVGVTTNPTIFQKALEDSEEYSKQLRDLALRGVDVGEAVRALTTFDVRWACQELRPLWVESGWTDGRVSIEVDPRIAHDTERTVAEGRALWWLVAEPNLFIKVPATRAGLPAITQLIGEGISVNVTLIFSLERYREVIEAYMTGLEAARKNGVELSTIESVASFFVSRVDSEIDKRLEGVGEAGAALRGKAALANARLAYEMQEELFGSKRWQELESRGANRQRPLWASTGVKDPAYPDTMYVTELVAPGTVNTMPAATLEAVHDHGEVSGNTVSGRYEESREVLSQLEEIGISYSEVVEKLEDEGVAKFEESWNALIATVKEQLEMCGAEVNESGGASPAGDGPAAASPE